MNVATCLGSSRQDSQHQYHSIGLASLPFPSHPAVCVLCPSCKPYPYLKRMVKCAARKKGEKDPTNGSMGEREREEDIPVNAIVWE